MAALWDALQSGDAVAVLQSALLVEIEDAERVANGQQSQAQPAWLLAVQLAAAFIVGDLYVGAALPAVPAGLTVCGDGRNAARHAWRRAPQPCKTEAMPAAVWQIGQHMWRDEFESAHLAFGAFSSAADDVTSLVKAAQGAFFGVLAK